MPCVMLSGRARVCSPGLMGGGLEITQQQQLLSRGAGACSGRYDTAHGVMAPLRFGLAPPIMTEGGRATFE